MTPVVDAVTLGAAAGIKTVATTAVSDTYNHLKALLARREIDVSVLEREPDSAAQRAALQKTLEGLADGSDAIDDELLAAAAATVEAVAEHDADSAQVVGVNIEDVQAAFIQIGTVTSTGDGVLARNIRTPGGFTIDSVHAGAPTAPPDPSPR